VPAHTIPDLRELLINYAKELKAACNDFDDAVNRAPIPDVASARKAEAEIKRLWARILATMRELRASEPENVVAVATLEEIKELPGQPILEDARTMIRLLMRIPPRKPAEPEHSPADALNQQREPCAEVVGEKPLAGQDTVTKETAAKYLNVTPRQIRKLVSGGTLHSVGKGHYKKITTESLLRYKGVS
jgi:hypothetical protein